MKRHVRAKIPDSQPQPRKSVPTKPPCVTGKGMFCGANDKGSAPYSAWRLLKNLSYLRCDLRRAFVKQTGKWGPAYIRHKSYPVGGHAAFEARTDSLLPSSHMTWGNYLDDWFAWWVRPPSSFDLGNPEERAACFSFDNLSPQPPPYPDRRIVFGNGFLSD